MAEAIVDQNVIFIQLSQLYTLSEHDKFFVWMYYPFDILPLERIMQIAQELEIPHNILLRKLIAGLLYNNKDESEIINFFMDNAIMTHYQIPELQTIIAEVQQIPLNELEIDKFREAIDFGRLLVITEQQLKAQNAKELNQTKVKYKKNQWPHTGYPPPDPDQGRPHMGWAKCAFKGCGQQFQDAVALRQHLENHGKHTWGFHWFHERACGKLFLTPEKVMTEGWTKCPSLVCDKGSFKTPDELCQHLRQLGIVPFWKWGEVVQIDEPNKFKKKPAKFYSLTETSYSKVFACEECAICMDNKPNAVTEPCNHNVLCLTCCSKVKKCPLCQTMIKKAMPF